MRVRGPVERGGSAIIMLIARNPTTYIYQVFLFSALVGVFHYTFPISYSDFWEGRVSGSGWCSSLMTRVYVVKIPSKYRCETRALTAGKKTCLITDLVGWLVLGLTAL